MRSEAEIRQKLREADEWVAKAAQKGDDHAGALWGMYATAIRFVLGEN